MSTSDAQDIADLKRQVQRQGELIDDLYRRLGESAAPAAKAPAADAPPPEIADAIRAGKLPLAVKLWHERTGVGLAEAKQQVEGFARTIGR
jgi:ribosomal protein L7/L12